MNKLKRPLCWLSKHRWLLQDDLTVGELTAHKEVSWYVYKCQRCGVWMRQRVIHIRTPTPNNSKTVGK